MNNETRKETQVLPKDVRYVGADDLTLPLFENQYPVQPMGVLSGFRADSVRDIFRTI